MEGIKLRDYQQVQLDEVRAVMPRHKHLIWQLTTGGGKTVCFSKLAQLSLQKGNKVLILSNRSELLTQTGGALESFGIKAQYISPKFKGVPTASCVVGMAQTLQRRYEKPEWRDYLKSINLLIIDEAHFLSYDFILKSRLFDNKHVLGFTATPVRSGNQTQLGDFYTAISVGVSASDLVKAGFLVPARYFAIDAPDLSKVEYDYTQGDYKSSQLFKAFDSQKRYDGVVKEWTKWALGLPTIVFCANQEHAIKTCIEFDKAGIRAKYLISGIAEDKSGHQLMKSTAHLTGKRDSLIQDFKNGEFEVLVNAGILTFGFDYPALKCVVLNMATKSLQKYLQAVGRGTRPAKGKKDFLVLDFGNNFSNFGKYENPRAWHLWHESSDGNGLVMTKECPLDGKDKEGKSGCGRLWPISYKVCKACGFIFATDAEIREGELTEILDGKFRFKDMTAKQLDAYRELHGYAKGWTFRQLWIGGGDKGLKKGMRELGYDWGYIYRTLKMYELYSYEVEVVISYERTLVNEFGEPLSVKTELESIVVQIKNTNKSKVEKLAIKKAGEVFEGKFKGVDYKIQSFNILKTYEDKNI